MGSARDGRVYREANGTWTYVVDVAPLGASRKQVKRRGFLTKAAALDHKSKTVRAAAEGTFVDRNKLTVGEYLDAWLGTQAARLRPTTLSNYRRLIDRHVRPALGDARLQALSPEDLDRLYAKMLTDGRRRGREVRGCALSARTVRLVHTIIRKALADAVRKGAVVHNVADRADPPTRAQAKAPEVRAWSAAELRAFVAHDEVRAHPLYPLLVLAGTTGMRRGELCGLRWSDLDLDAGYLTVGAQVIAVEGELHVSAPKTDRSRRRVDLDPTTTGVLREHRAAQRAHRVMLGAGWRDHDLVFPAVDGSPLHPDVVTRVFPRLVAATGLPPITFHGLRHSHASHMIEAGQHTKHIADRLGHASAAFTLDRYGHSGSDGLARAAQATAALVWGGAPALAVVEDVDDEGPSDAPAANL